METAGHQPAALLSLEDAAVVEVYLQAANGSTGVLWRRARPMLQQRRRELHLTQTQLAEKVGVAQTFIGMLERGENRARAELVEKIAVELALSSDDLFEDAESLYPDAREDWKQLLESVEAVYEQVGRSTAKAAKELGYRSPETVRRALVELGIDRRPVGGSWQSPTLPSRACANPACEELVQPRPADDRAGLDLYCSNECRWDVERKHPLPQPRTCARDGCDIEFQPDAHDAAEGMGLYCSPSCYHLASRRYPEPEARDCPFCGESFTPRRPALWKQKYCSTSHEMTHFWELARLGKKRLSVHLFQHWPEETVVRWGGAMVRQWKLRHEKRPGRPREYTDLQAKAVRQMKAADSDLGYGRIAERTGLSTKQVRGILNTHT